MCNYTLYYMLLVLQIDIICVCVHACVYISQLDLLLPVLRNLTSDLTCCGQK